MTATWVAGCDGSRSAVREMNHIAFPGAPYAQTFFVADTEATGSMRPHELNVYLWRDGFHLFFPMRGKDRWRVIGILPEQFRSREHVTFEELIPSIKGEAGTDLDFKHCSWFSVYRIQHRAAERFRDRRCFLLGDAAHIHSPAGAQGMNTGLQDAYNLAWKLALVVRGRADAALLDTYEQERVPVAKRLLETTDRAFQAGRVGGLAAEAVADQDHRQGRRDGDEVRAGPAICLPDDFADRDQLSRQPAIASAWPVCRRVRPPRGIASPGCGSSFERTVRPRTSTACSMTRASTCSSSDSPPVRPRANSATWFERWRFHGRPRTIRNSHAPGSASRRSICCVPMATWGFAGLEFDAEAVARYLAQRVHVVTDAASAKAA